MSKETKTLQNFVDDFVEDPDVEIRSKKLAKKLASSITALEKQLASYSSDKVKEIDDSLEKLTTTTEALEADIKSVKKVKEVSSQPDAPSTWDLIFNRASKDNAERNNTYLAKLNDDKYDYTYSPEEYSARKSVEFHIPASLMYHGNVGPLDQPVYKGEFDFSSDKGDKIIHTRIGELLAPYDLSDFTAERVGANVIQLREKMALPVVQAQVPGADAAGAASAVEYDPTIADYTLEPTHHQAVFVTMPYTLPHVTTPNMETWFQRSVPARLMSNAYDWLLQSDNTGGKNYGLFNVPGITTEAAAAVDSGASPIRRLSLTQAVKLSTEIPADGRISLVTSPAGMTNILTTEKRPEKETSQDLADINAKTLLGYPIYRKDTIPINLGAGTDETKVLCGSYGNVWLAFYPTIQVVKDIYTNAGVGKTVYTFRLAFDWQCGVRPDNFRIYDELVVG